MASRALSRMAVVGHVEWVRFIAVEGFPERGAVTAGDLLGAHAGGGAVVAAAALAELGAEVDFFCALGRDAEGEAALAELKAREVGVQAAWREQPTRGVLALLGSHGERAIISLGERLEPNGADALDWGRVDRADGAYLTAGDAGAARAARRARVLVATPRARQGLIASEVAIDALVFSGGDRDERRWAERLESRARLIVRTEGAEGGCWWGESEGRWAAAPVPGEPRDDYGCGDAFAAGLALALAAGRPVAEAAATGAKLGASMLTRVGAP